MDKFLAIDLGTSNCRSAVFDSYLNMLALVDAEYPLLSFSPTHIEQDAMLWWQSVKKTIREAALAAGSDNIRSISISSQGISLVPIDRDGTPLMNALSWLDTRAQEQENRVEAKYGLEYIYHTTGKRANAIYSLSKLIWLMENHREIYDKAYKILLPMDFLLYHLCGEAVTDHTMASGTMFYDIHRQAWSPEILADHDIDPAKLPDISWGGRAIGEIKNDVADELGLERDVLVCIGGQDQKCAALGAGVSDGTATVSLGTASSITQLSAKPPLDEQLRIPCFSYLWPETWSFEGLVNTAASSYQWFRNTFAPQYSYGDLDELAEEAATKGDRAFFYPYLAGMTSPFWGDGLGSFSGLSFASDIGQLALSVLDGVACNIKANLDIMQQINHPVTDVRLFGGGAKSPVWCRRVADMLGLPVKTGKSPETALAGAAMLAKQGFDGQRPDAPQTIQTYEPDEKNVSVYKEYYSIYIEQLEKML